LTFAIPPSVYELSAVVKPYFKQETMSGASKQQTHSAQTQSAQIQPPLTQSLQTHSPQISSPQTAVNKNSKTMVLAGGCFWGMEELIRKQPGVLNTTVGYTGGKVENPTYQNHEGHAEAVEIEYDPKRTSYRKLLDFFFRIHNPTTLNRQGNDIGSSYRSAVFYGNEEEKQEAADFIEIVNASGRWKAPVVTTLEPLKQFYAAEDYHQDYLQKNPAGYTCHLVYFDSYLK
jgi:peptide-methionine (S)-S-oxide reductase